MRFRKLLLIFVLSSFFVHTQVRLTIDVTVLSMDDKTVIEGCPIILKTDEGKIFEFKTDDEGKFHYLNSSSTFKKGEIYTQTNKDVKTDYAPMGFLASDDRLKIDISDKTPNTKIILSDTFYLKPVSFCPDFPAFNFKNNSLSYDTVFRFDIYSGVDSSYFYPVKSMEKLLNILNIAPRIIIEVAAYADYEEINPDSICMARAEQMINELVKRGINKKRLIGKAYGIKRLHYDKKEIKKHKRKERERLHAINRRIVFKILSWDFVPSTVILKGSVLNGSDHTPIPGAKIIYRDNLGILKQFAADKDGTYYLKFEEAKFKKAELYIQTDKDTRTPSSPNGFISTDDRLKVEITDSTKFPLKLKKDFELTPNPGCTWFESIKFKPNSTVYDTVYPPQIDPIMGGDSSSFYPSTTIELLKNTLLNNPSIIIELSAHCSAEEKKPDKLSQQRAEKVKTALIKFGINPKRLSAKGYGIKKLKITTQQIAKAKSKSEKEELSAMNRRCIFKIIAWDFVDPNAPPVKEEKYHPKISGEEEK